MTSLTHTAGHKLASFMVVFFRLTFKRRFKFANIVTNRTKEWLRVLSYSMAKDRAHDTSSPRFPFNHSAPASHAALCLDESYDYTSGLYTEGP